jgi:FecR protein
MFRPWGVLCLLALPAWSQSVISVYSGVINYAEGAVLLDGHPLEQQPGRFEEIKPGSELQADEGRAEILLTPGVFLRIGPGSSIRMVSNLLADTRVELLHGAAIIDAAEPTPQTSVTMTLRNYQVHIRKAGRYRFDSIPPQLRVSDGEAEVSSTTDSLLGTKPVTVESGHVLHLLSGVMMTDYPLADELDNWDQDRSEQIARDNQQISQTPEIGSLVDAAQNDPLLSNPGLIAPGLAGLGAYGTSAGLYPPGGSISPYGYNPPYSYGSPYGYSSPYPYYGYSSLYPYSMFSYGLYPYGLYSYGIFPYGLYGLPGTIVVPTYHPTYGIGSLLGIGTSGYGYRGVTFPRSPNTIRSPGYTGYHPTITTPIRSTPIVRPGVHVIGRR